MNAGIDFLEFKPSEIAAAVAISVTGEAKTVVDTEKAISVLSQHVEKVKVSAPKGNTQMMAFIIILSLITSK